MKRFPVLLSFEWDKGNIDKNLKHNVTDKESEEVFNNKPLEIFKDIKHSDEEQRYTAYGVTNSGKKLMIVFTIRKQSIRVISTRDQNKKERRVYEKKI